MPRRACHSWPSQARGKSRQVSGMGRPPQRCRVGRTAAGHSIARTGHDAGMTLAVLRSEAAVSVGIELEL
jgi:hypothetical protein